MKKIIALIIAVLPFNALRLICYRRLLGYQIAPSARIAPFNVILVGRCELGRITMGPFNLMQLNELKLADNVSIGRFNRIKFITALHVGASSHMGSWNVAFGTRPGVSPFKLHEQLKIGESSVITSHHSFDLSDEITLGDDVTIAGDGTQFWTHGFDLNHVKIQAPITIDDHVYVGSRALIVQGVKIISHTMIGAGTTVSGSITESGFYVSSALVRKSDVANYSSAQTVAHGGYNFARRA